MLAASRYERHSIVQRVHYFYRFYVQIVNCFRRHRSFGSAGSLRRLEETMSRSEAEVRTVRTRGTGSGDLRSQFQRGFTPRARVVVIWHGQCIRGPETGEARAYV